MARKILTDAEVEKEIEELRNSPAVSLARLSDRLKYKRRQQLYILRDLERRGREMMAAGITRDVLKAMYADR